MTYPDKTCYPVASQNTKDFYNLVDVYLDAVFYPRLTKEVFEQEGWHFELDEARLTPLLITCSLSIHNNLFFPTLPTALTQEGTLKKSQI